MKNKRLIICAALLLGIGTTCLHAQTMYVEETGGGQTAYALNGIRKLTFSEGDLIVSQTGGNTNTFALSELRYLRFDNLTEVARAEKPMSQLNLFPNPVNDILNIDLSGAKALNSNISILSIEGKILQNRQIAEAGIISIDISSLPSGFYLCRYTNGNEIQTVKIIKQ